MKINRYQFYVEVVEGKTPIKEIFTGLPNSMQADDFDELFDDFSAKIREDFNSSNFGSLKKSRSRFSRRLRSRIRIAIFLLSLCALGATFDDKVYSYTLNFILKKELFLEPISLN